MGGTQRAARATHARSAPLASASVSLGPKVSYAHAAVVKAIASPSGTEAADAPEAKGKADKASEKKDGQPSEKNEKKKKKEESASQEIATEPTQEADEHLINGTFLHREIVVLKVKLKHQGRVIKKLEGQKKSLD